MSSSTSTPRDLELPADKLAATISQKLFETPSSLKTANPSDGTTALVQHLLGEIHQDQNIHHFISTLGKAYDLARWIPGAILDKQDWSLEYDVMTTRLKVIIPRISEEDSQIELHYKRSAYTNNYNCFLVQKWESGYPFYFSLPTQNTISDFQNPYLWGSTWVYALEDGVDRPHEDSTPNQIEMYVAMQEMLGTPVQRWDFTKYYLYQLASHLEVNEMAFSEKDYNKVRRYIERMESRMHEPTLTLGR
jgi:hypothetical protein